MCDTFVALPTHTADASVLFAKNSDRCPNEPQQVLRTFPVDYPEDARLECTYITIAQARHTNACLLCKPSWMWGCEMGANEYGLHIGNEAVFTREPVQKEGGLTGMDLVRLALERCMYAREAADLIIAMLMRYGQGGDCGYDKPFYYHNSFLIADARSAYVLETAGEFWALKRVNGYYALSNALTIENDFDEIHAGAIDYAIAKRRCRDRADFSFARCFSDPVKTRAACAQQRRAQGLLALEKGGLTTRDMMTLLRSHNENARPFSRGSCADICMHAGANAGASQTTGSLIGKISQGYATEFVTGMSSPCLAVFKPYWLSADTTQLVFPLYAARASRESWLWRENLPRDVRAGRIDEDALGDYLARRDSLEARFFAQSEQLHASRAVPSVVTDVARRAVSDEIALLESVMGRHRPKAAPRGGLFYRLWWKKRDALLGKKRPEEA